MTQFLLNTNIAGYMGGGAMGEAMSEAVAMNLVRVMKEHK